MDWTLFFHVFVFPVALAIIGYVLILTKRWVDLHVKNQLLRQWADGALSAAGKAYIIFVALRQANPNETFEALTHKAADITANDFFNSYKGVIAKLAVAGVEATPKDAKSRVLGDLGPMLASDPTVSASPITATIYQGPYVGKPT